MRKYFVITICAILAFSCTGNRKSDSDFIVAAYVWPSCHDDSLAHHYLWEEGIGEWEVIKKGDPRFEGHYQPRQPLWGYEMDDDPEVVEKWISTALEHGVNTFCYDWYWFMEYPYLEGALNDGFLKAPSNGKMNFYLMWANHDVRYNYWNYHKWGDNRERLFNPDVDWDNFKTIVDRVINQYFVRDNYLKFDNCPVFAIFNMDNLVRSFGGTAAGAKEAVEYFRSEVKKAGFKDLFLMENYGGSALDKEYMLTRTAELKDSIGIDGISFYNMGGFSEDYLTYGANSLKIREHWDETFDIPVFPCVSIGWDDTPRYPAKGKADVTHYHVTPQAFESFLLEARAYAESHPEQPKLITINAWNEWIEGSYLLPDRLNGFGYLDAVKSVFGPVNSQSGISQ